VVLYFLVDKDDKNIQDTQPGKISIQGGKMGESVSMNPNRLEQYLQKPAEEFTRKDLIKFIKENNIEVINFRYAGEDGNLKTLNFVINSEKHLDQLLAERYFLSNPRNSVSIGVGSGLFASRLGIEYGVEPSKQMAKLAERRGIKVKIGRAEDVPFEDERFDTVLLSTVLSYVDDPEKAVKEAYRILKPGGHIVVSFLAREGSYAMLYDLAYLRGKYDPEISPKYPYPIKFIRGAHWNSIDEVTNLLKEAGFVDLKYVQTLTKHPKYTNDEVEQPIEGYKRGDFIVVQGRKP